MYVCYLVKNVAILTGCRRGWSRLLFCLLFLVSIHASMPVSILIPRSPLSSFHLNSPFRLEPLPLNLESKTLNLSKLNKDWYRMMRAAGYADAGAGGCVSGGRKTRTSQDLALHASFVAQELAVSYSNLDTRVETVLRKRNSGLRFVFSMVTVFNGLCWGQRMDDFPAAFMNAME